MLEFYKKCYVNKFENLNGIIYFLVKHTQLSQEERENLTSHIKNKNLLYLSKPKHMIVLISSSKHSGNMLSV